MRRVLLVACLLGLTALAGCADQDPDTDDDGSTATASSTRPAATGTLSASASTTVTATSTSTSTGTPGNATIGNATGNATGNQTGNSTAWSHENRTGTISGTFVPLLTTTLTKTEAFVVNATTQALVLNLTATGSEVTLEVRPPGCDAATCANKTKATGGKARMTFEQPPPAGNWTARLSISGTAGSGSAQYVLTIERLEPAGNRTLPP